MNLSNQRKLLQRISRLSEIDSLRTPIGIVLIAILLRPIIGHDLLLGGSHIATTMLIWMLFATAFNLLLGYAGLLSFGHAMFLGIGVYATAIGISQLGLPFSVMVVVGVIIAAMLAYVIGRIIIGYGEIYFAMLTLAFSMGVYFIANANPLGITGGADGLRSGTTPEWITSFRGERLIDTPLLGGMQPDYYWFVAIIFVVMMLLIWQIVRSPFGRSLVAIRDNEDLALAMGINTRRYKVWAFTLSAGFSAVAGALLMINSHGAALETFAPITSAEVLLMAIFGGVAFYFGPAVGALGWYLVREYLLSIGEVNVPLVGTLDLGGVLSYWQFFFGLAFVIVILVSPRDGIWGFIRNRISIGVRAVRRWLHDE